MKAIFYTLFIATFFSLMMSCGTETNSTKEVPAPIKAQATNKKLDPKFLDMLNSMKSSPNDHGRNGALVNNIAKEYIRLENPKKALEILKTGIIFHSDSKLNTQNIDLFIETLQSTPGMKTDYINFIQSMQIGNAAFPSLAEHTKNIPSGEKSIRDKIKEIQNNLTDASTGRLDLIKVNEFVDVIELFVMANPENDQSASYLKLAAEVVNSIKVFPRAIQFYDWILTKFPNSKEAPQALFMKGFTLDDGMKKKAAAKPVYEEFLRKYPKNDFADDTQFLLNNITKTDEEIIKQFEDKK